LACNWQLRKYVLCSSELQLDLLAVPLKGGEASTPMGPYVDAVLAALEPFKGRVSCTLKYTTC
jgi:hypothetical protein